MALPRRQQTGNMSSEFEDVLSNEGAAMASGLRAVMRQVRWCQPPLAAGLLLSSVSSLGRNENDIGDGGKAEADLSKSAYIEYLLSNVNNPSVGKVQVNSCQDTEMSRSMYYTNIETSKPPYSYKELILKVFDLVKQKPLDLRDIYFLITATFPYYKPGGAWQSAVRHVLFSDPNFVAEPDTNLWRINPIVTFQNKHFGFNGQSIHNPSYQFPYPCHGFHSNTCSVKDTCQDAVLNCRTNFNCTKTSYASLDVRKPDFDYVFSNQCNMLPNIENQPYMPPISRESLNECNICATVNNGNNSSHRYHLNEIFRNGCSDVCTNMCQQNVDKYMQPTTSSSCRFAGCDSSLNSGLSLSLANTLMNLSFESFIPTISSTSCKPISTLSEVSAQCTAGTNGIEQQSVQELNSVFANNDSQDSGKIPTNCQTKVYDELECCLSMDFIDSSEPINERNGGPSSESSISFQTCLNETNNLTGVDLSSCAFADLSDDSNITKSAENLNTDSPRVNSTQPKINTDSQIPIYGPVSTREAKSSSLNSSNKDETLVENEKLYHQTYTVSNNTVEVAPSVTTSFSSLKESVEKSNDCNNVTSDFDGSISTNRSMQIENGGLKMTDLSATNKSTHADIISQTVEMNNSGISENVLNKANIAMDSQTCTFADLSEDSNITKSNENLIADSSCVESIQSKNHMVTKVPIYGPISARETKSSTSKRNSENGFVIGNKKLNRQIFTNSNKVLKVSVNTSFSSLKESVEKSNDLSNVTPQCNRPIIINTSKQVEDDNLKISKLSADNKSTDADCVSQTVKRSKANWEISLINIDIHLSALENLKELHPTLSETVSTSLIETTKSQVSLPGVPSNKGIECDTSSKSNSSSLDSHNLKVPVNLNNDESSAELKECSALFEEVSTGGGSSELSFSDEIKLDGEGIPSVACYSKSQTDIDHSMSSFPNSPDDKSGDQATKSPKKRRSAGPLQIRGFSKPSGSYCQMITQALAVCPDKRATALQICELIATKYEYYRHYTGSWQGSIYSALTNRKKFFMIVDMNSNGEYIWGFNPMFEKYITNKWLSKKLKSAMFMNTPTTATRPILPQTGPPMSVARPVRTMMSSVISETVTLSDSEETLTPVIVSTGSLSTEAEAMLGLEPLEPEYTLADPALQDINKQINMVTANRWEPVIAVSMDTSEGEDFSISNWKINNIISNEETIYRATFQKEHTNVIEKFRLHCTVCDCHLGTKASEAKERVRLHSRLGVLTCVECYRLTQSVTKVPSCFWCRRCEKGTHFFCSSCPAKFCENCLKRNFGLNWWKSHFMNTKNWLCFVCNNKQIWPHRAIAHCLLRHYCQLSCLKKLMKNGTKNIASSDETQFFYEDKSSCCKETTKTSSVLSSKMCSQSSNDHLGTSVTQVLPTISPSGENNSQINNDPASSSTGSPQDVKSRINNKSDLILPRLSKPQVLIVEKQQPSHIYVQSPVGVPSVTLNTGTQYIHNVYPDKNYVVVQSPNLNRLTSGSISNMSSSPQTQSASNPVLESSYSPSLLNRSNFTIHHRPKYTPPTFVDCSAPQMSKKLVKTETVSTTDQVKGSIKNVLQSPTIQNVHILPGGMLVTNRIDESGDMIVPDQPQELVSHEKEPALSIREKLKEKIQNRPMPKSKKQSLLRAVLMNESIESMKKQLQTVDVSPRSVPAVSPKVPSVNTSDADKDIEEPILKSIIETATERLLNIQRKSVVPQNSIASASDVVDLSDENDLISSQTKNASVPPVESRVPKIKIKTLQELQQIEGCVDIEVNNQNQITNSKIVELNREPEPAVTKLNEEPEPAVTEVNKEPEVTVVSSETNSLEVVKDVNVTGLKQGIIEASRTLVSTQKKFKELAKEISSNLSYHTKQAVDLVTKFQEILKSCSNQIDVIDRNVKNHYGHLVPNHDIDSILKSIKISSGETLNSNAANLSGKKRKMKNANLHAKKSHVGYSSVEILNLSNVDVFDSDRLNQEVPEKSQQQIDASDEIENTYFTTDRSIKRTRDMVDINPLGRKVILGTPEVTREDLERVPGDWSSPIGQVLSVGDASHEEANPVMKELLKRQNILRHSAKKRSMWDTKRRKCSFLRKKGQYNKDGSIRKRKGRPSKPAWKDDLSCSNQRQKPTIDPRLRRRPSPQRRPLRSSERKRSDDCIVSYLPANYVIKPCSVVIHRLSGKVVRLSEKRVESEMSIS